MQALTRLLKLLGQPLEAHGRIDKKAQDRPTSGLVATRSAFMAAFSSALRNPASRCARFAYRLPKRLGQRPLIYSLPLVRRLYSAHAACVRPRPRHCAASSNYRPVESASARRPCGSNPVIQGQLRTSKAPLPTLSTFEKFPWPRRASVTFTRAASVQERLKSADGNTYVTMPSGWPGSRAGNPPTVPVMHRTHEPRT